MFFYTSGHLPLSEVQQSDLLAFIRSGKGFAGSHSASDTFYKWKEYGDLIGGYFDGHPWHQKVKIIIATNVGSSDPKDLKEFAAEVVAVRTPTRGAAGGGAPARDRSGGGS